MYKEVGKLLKIFVLMWEFPIMFLENDFYTDSSLLDYSVCCFVFDAFACLTWVLFP